MEKLITLKNARTAALIAGLLTVFFLFFLPKTRLSYDFERFFPEEDQELDFYMAHRAQFETDNDFILIAIAPKQGVFNPTFLKKLRILCDSLAVLPNVEGVQSILNYRTPILGPLGWTPGTKLQIDNQSRLASDSMRLCNDPLVYQNLISTDRRSTSIIIRNNPKIIKKDGDALLENINRLLIPFEGEEFHLAGKIHGQYHYIIKMGQELALFTGISLILLCFFLFFTFRTGWGIWLPISIVAITLIWLLGFITAIGQELNILCTILPTIVFVVGIADSVHILEKFVHELRHGLSKLEALRIAYKHVGFATLLTAITNAIGFVTLLISNIQPIRAFGIFTAIGILFAFILTYLILPLALLSLPAPKVAAVKNQDTFWAKTLPALFRWVMNRKKLVLGAYALLIVASVVGLLRIKINNYLLEDWNENDPQKKDYVYFENNYAGVRPVEFQLTAQSGHQLLDSAVAVQIDKLETYLEQTYGVGAIQSPITILKTLNRGAHGGDPDFFVLPKTEEDRSPIADALERALRDSRIRTLIDSTGSRGRLSGRITDYGGFAFKQKNKDLNRFIETQIDGQLLGIRQTGMPMLIDLNNEHLSSDIGYELGLSLLMVALLMGLLFRKWRIIVIALIPNLVPLLVVAGIMGFTGIDLKVSTSLIFSIAFGIAVDDTIHFMSNLKLEMNAGKSPMWALRSTYFSTGKAVTITNLVLLSGFFSLILSSFASTFYLGLLVSVTLLVALIAELTLMPILFAYLYKK
ncbi:MAG TPA: MMPL family transporter [Luteibaculaceae bacterium]|nr:MMPL family transporter [Luteibaculaceae bacterium]